MINVFLTLLTSKYEVLAFVSEQLARSSQTLDHLFSTVSMMNIKVNDCYLLDPLTMNAEKVSRCNSHVVEDTEPISLMRSIARVPLLYTLELTFVQVNHTVHS